MANKLLSMRLSTPLNDVSFRQLALGKQSPSNRVSRVLHLQAARHSVLGAAGLHSVGGFAPKVKKRQNNNIIPI